jgi:hypothetical protein
LQNGAHQHRPIHERLCRLGWWVQEKKPVRAAPAVQQEAGAEEKAKPKPKKGGFLQALGINQETVYVDEA